MLIHDLNIKCRFAQGFDETLIGPAYRELIRNIPRLTGSKRTKSQDEMNLIE